ncbi:sigma-54-dependent transcriptional regulator [Alteromonas lipolytica]|uniref:Sigma-54-dependent Fis family transcriptional regulator n=1 Tax=Alteromonas lipolytica TaxID=1856405 RepID=A0A1E8FAY6_9ALTE|nr:sigma-54 dependent transcriptional regulator [Alteromonas lipolytica]OFI33070.1 sigma-54-dependent Fis family transcriptional regulator [Alteromonas lipolytica]GGF62748.1 sigma-54-dependent Fis family transcriptional regulator [Alteromonas lipolytica]
MPVLAKEKVLIVEDSTSLNILYQQYLRNENVELLTAGNGAEARFLVTKHQPALVLLDLGLPDIDGMELLEWIKQGTPQIEVVIITSQNAIDTVVEVMRLGAMDFIEKPFDGKRLITTVKNALKQIALSQQVETLQKTYARSEYQGFIGSSLAMQAIYKIIEAAAPSRATVFITGESGSGKEVCARAIHEQSPRKNAPFIALNCGAIPRELMESEIFGHIKGAFTGAQKSREGVAAQANGGTLFLDEIAEMDMDLQTKLLRFLQTGKFQPVGSDKEISVDIRFVCATNKKPLDEVKAGRFREDLYYRLQVIPIHLPRLAERGTDTLAIADYFLKQFAAEENKDFTSLSDKVQQLFLQYDWPGNVRQLQNVIQNIVVLHNATQVEIEHLPHPLNTVSVADNSSIRAPDIPQVPVAAVSPMVIKPLAVTEREAIEAAIAFCDGNIPQAAQLLEVSPSTIYRKKVSWE